MPLLYIPIDILFNSPNVNITNAEGFIIQANLFDIVPPTLFQPLAAPSRQIYVTVLLRLYKLAEDASFIGEEQAVEVVLDTLANITVEEEILWVDDDITIQLALQGEPLDDAESPEADGYRRQRIQARAILRRLVATGWLKDETQSDLSVHYTLLEYTFPILDGFLRAIERRPTEFEGLIYSTYQLLKNPDPHISGYVILQQVYDQTRQIVSGLKQLQHNIGAHIAHITKTVSSVPDLLNNFALYRTRISPTYHRLKTADHLSRYRLDIQRSLQSMADSTVWLDATVGEMQRRRSGITSSSAQSEIYQQLSYIQTQFEQMGQVINTIDDRHSRYAEAAVVQIRYGVANGQDTISQLIEVCHRLRDIPGAGHQSAPEPLQSFFQLFEANFVNQNSLYAPRRVKQRFQPLPLDVLEVNSAMKQEILQDVQERLDDLITPKRVWAYLSPYLERQGVVESAALPLNSIEDWLMLIGLQVFSEQMQDKYQILPPPDNCPWVQTPTFRCVNYRFSRHEG